MIMSELMDAMNVDILEAMRNGLLSVHALTMSLVLFALPSPSSLS